MVITFYRDYYFIEIDFRLLHYLFIKTKRSKNSSFRTALCSENIFNPTFKKKKSPFVLSNVTLPSSGYNWEPSPGDFKNHSQKFSAVKF